MHTEFTDMPISHNHAARCDDALSVEYAKLTHAGIEATPLNHLWSFRIAGMVNQRTGSDVFNISEARALRREKRGRVITEGDV